MEKRELSDAQKAKLLQALTLRESDFLDTCLLALKIEEVSLNDANRDLYERLVRGEINKVQALEIMFKRLGYRALSVSHPGTLRYDLDNLLSFAPESDERFVSLLIDFFAERSPTPDEALQFGQTLATGREDRHEVLERILVRYSDKFAIEDGDILARISPAQGYVLCQTWRNHLILHPELTTDTSFADCQARFVARSGLVFHCDLTLAEHQHWELNFDIVQKARAKITIEIQDLDSGMVIVRVESRQNLIGLQRLQLARLPQNVRVSLIILGEESEESRVIEPKHISLNPECV